MKNQKTYFESVKKYFKVLPLFLFISSSTVTHAQTTVALGNSCANAITISPSANENYIDYGMPQDEIWFSFTATDSLTNMIVDMPENPQDTPAAHIQSLNLYSGSCTNLSLIESTSGSHHGLNDTLPAIFAKNLQIGNVYFLQITTFGIVTCRKCVPTTNQIYFSLNLQNIPPPTISSGCPGLFCSYNLVQNWNFETPTTNPHSVPLPASSGMHYVTQFHQFPNVYTDEYTIASGGITLFTSNSTDYSSGNGNFFLYGDAPSKKCTGCGAPWEETVWTQPVQVVSGHNYKFSAYFKNIGAAAYNGAYFQMLVDGNVVLNWSSVPAGDTWGLLCGVWNSTVNGTVHLAIKVQGEKSPLGNDFGIDDISFVSDIMDPPSVSVAPTIFCPGQQVTLQATGGDLFTWYITQPSIYATGPTAIFYPTTPISVTLVNSSSNPQCSTTNSVTVTLTPNVPFPSFTPDLATACVGTTITFTNNTSIISGTATYSWNFGDNTTSTATAPSHAYSNPGTYTVTLTATNNCGSNSTSQVVYIIPSTATYNANCCSESHTYTHEGAIRIQSPISNPTLWQGVHYYVRGTIYIYPGCELDIVQSSIVEFDPLSMIYVAPGGILKVDNSTLTGLETCGGTMWQGIEVAGDPTKTQTQIQNAATGELYQGKVILTTDAKIELAHNGVVLGIRNANSTLYDPNSGGGILLATTAIFKNCGYSVRFITYPFVNNSQITNCTFYSTTLPDPGYNNTNGYTYPNQANPLYAYANQSQHAYAFGQTLGVKSVQFTGNSFSSAEYGIIGVNSSLRVGGVNALQGNNFSDIVDIGEIHGNIFNSPFYANNIQRNTYLNTFVPIETWSGLADRIYKNSIPNGAFVGIATVSSQSIFVNDNVVNNCLLGVSSSNTGTLGGLIGYTTTGNIFTSCKNGVWLNGNNAYLQVHCNIHNNPTSTNYVSNWRNFGSLANQGTLPIMSDQDPAGNFFVLESPLRNQITSTNSVFDYYSHKWDVNSIVPTVQPQAVGMITSANVINTNIAETSTSCNSGPPCTTCGSQIAQSNVTISQLEAERSSIESSLDGGQTQVLLDAVSSAMPSGQLKSLLITNSPLSDQVLLAYIEKTGTPPGNFKEVIVPNSPVSATVRVALYSRITSMPSGIKNQIIAAQSNLTNRTLAVVDAELQSAVGTRQQLYNQQEVYYLDQLDVDSTMKDSVYALLSIQNTEAAREAIASSYLADENYPSASTAIANLDPTTPEENSERDLLALMYSIYSSGRDVFQMTLTEEQQVRSIAGLPNDCSARASAKVILFLVFGEPLTLDINTNNRMEDASYDSLAVSQVGIFLGESYPNPASDEVTIEYSLNDGSVGLLRFYDMNGQLIHSEQLKSGDQFVTFSVNEWADGVYMYEMIVDDKTVAYQKMVVTDK